jgi:hypothetical protein
MPADTILAHLQALEAERRRRAADTALNEKVVAVKAFQQRRFSLTYADLLASPRYGAAARFFLEELYGPNDFAERDAQFARVAPAVAQLFTDEIAAAIASLTELHALSEALDSAMALELAAPSINRAAYIRTWQRVGRADDRERQVALTLDIAGRIDRFTQRPLLRNSIRLMRGPAIAIGLSELHDLLERSFDTFGALQGADAFTGLVASRERTLAAALFATDPKKKPGGARATDPALAWLPAA